LVYHYYCYHHHHIIIIIIIIIIIQRLKSMAAWARRLDEVSRQAETALARVEEASLAARPDPAGGADGERIPCILFTPSLSCIFIISYARRSRG
jgi:type II secretory pathway pseudopilin PulG